MNCPKCDGPIAEDANFCARCGATVQTVSPSAGHCAHCGRTLEADARFCPTCGMPAGGQPRAKGKWALEVKDDQYVVTLGGRAPIHVSREMADKVVAGASAVVVPAVRGLFQKRSRKPKSARQPEEPREPGSGETAKT
jgi:hypothetical protein